MKVYKQYLLLVISLLTTDVILSGNVYSPSNEIPFFIQFLKKLSYLMWNSFFVFSKTIGAVMHNNYIYIIQALALFICVICIESYVVKNYIKSDYIKVIPRILLINITDIVLQSILGYLLCFFIDLHTYMKNFYATIYSFYILTIIASMILLTVRIVNAYITYRFFDKEINAAKLRKALIDANMISYSFIISLFFILKSIHNGLILI